MHFSEALLTIQIPERETSINSYCSFRRYIVERSVEVVSITSYCKTKTVFQIVNILWHVRLIETINLKHRQHRNQSKLIGNCSYRLCGACQSASFRKESRFPDYSLFRYLWKKPCFSYFLAAQYVQMIYFYYLQHPCDAKHLLLFEL